MESHRLSRYCHRSDGRRTHRYVHHIETATSLEKGRDAGPTHGENREGTAGRARPEDRVRATDRDANERDGNRHSCRCRRVALRRRSRGFESERRGNRTGFEGDTRFGRRCCRTHYGAAGAASEGEARHDRAVWHPGAGGARPDRKHRLQADGRCRRWGVSLSADRATARRLAAKPGGGRGDSTTHRHRRTGAAFPDCGHTHRRRTIDDHPRVGPTPNRDHLQCPRPRPRYVCR